MGVKTDVLMYVYNEYNHKTNTEIAEYFSLGFGIISVLFDETVQYTLKVAIVKPQIDIMTNNIFLGGEQVFVMEKIIVYIKELCFYKGR